MQRNECKPGTEVIIRGTIKADNGTDLHPIIVDFHGSKREEIRCLDPSQLEPARTKYDPARKYRTGDKVRFIHHGRRNYLVTPENGEECTVIENEKQEQVLIKCCGYTAVFHFADLELVKPVEEIEKEDTKTTAPEEGCCNPVTEPASTLEMIKEAYDRLEELVVRCNTPVLLCMLTGEKGGKIEHRNSTNNSVSKMTGKEGIGWNAARGFLYASATCFSGAPEAISQGIKYIFEFLERKKQKSVFSAIIDTPFDH